jgi:hypothetical protein
VTTGPATACLGVAPAGARPRARIAPTGALAALLLAGCPEGRVVGELCQPVTAGDGSAVQRFGSADYGCDVLDVRFPALAPGERLALVLSNDGGPDHATPRISVGGTGAPPARLAPSLRPVAGADASPARADAHAGHEVARARREAQAAAIATEGLAVRRERPALALQAAAAVGSRRDFCVFRFTGAGGAGVTERKAATLRHASAHALFYVVDGVQPGFDAAVATRPTLWPDLADAYERAGGIREALLAGFGPGTDADGDGQVILLFADLGQTGSGGFVVGYFQPTDTVRPADPACTGSGSNGADVIYLLDVASFRAHGPEVYTYDVILGEEYPGTMAHELQHAANFQSKCLSPGACLVEETWLNEGLSMVAEDAAGYGLNTETGRWRLGRYLDRYQDYSLTEWEGDAVGNYGGVHAFTRYLADRIGAGLTRALVGSRLTGAANLEAAAGLPLAEALPAFGGAALLSGEPFSPGAAFEFASGVAWSPLHETIGYASYTPIAPGEAVVASLRTDGWGAFVTGTGSGGPAWIRVASTTGRKPSALVVRFTGSLPR